MQTIERTIITALLRDMRAAGYQPAAVWDSEEYVMAGKAGALEHFEADSAPDEITRALTDKEALDELDAVDAYTTLHFTRHNARTWGNRGVMIVLGNGEDVISDYHAPLEDSDEWDGAAEPFERIIEAIYDRISDGECA